MNRPPPGRLQYSDSPHDEGSCTPLVVIRTIVHTLAVLLSICATSMLAYGLATPEWTTVWMHELKQYHEHGLWQDCVYSDSSTGVMQHETICAYKHYNPAHATHPQQQEHLGKEWQMITLVLCSVAGTLALIGTFFAFCSACVKCCAVTWTTLNLFAALSGVVGVIVFIRNTYDPQNLLILQGTEVAEQHLGKSYYFAAAGVATLFPAFVFSLITTVLVFLIGCKQRRTTIYDGREFHSLPQQMTKPFVHSQTFV